MPDEVDEATDKMERDMELARRNLLAAPVSTPIGACQNCEETFAAGDHRIFCDQDCEADFRRRQWAVKMRG